MEKDYSSFTLNGGLVTINGLTPDKNITTFQLSKIESMISLTLDKINSFVEVNSIRFHIKSVSQTGYAHRYSLNGHISTAIGTFIFTGCGWDIIDVFSDVLHSMETQQIRSKDRISTVHRAAKRYDKYCEIAP
ncbi:MAG: hypothetical protein KAJ47_03525 [Candidatus Aenigmarchaeota archaeon]|nr:hypothetical protein [Candidatus Aenigmarchaeota archaeon]